MLGQLLFVISKNFLSFLIFEQGDSGSPIWQFQRGQAVIVGIISATLNDSESGDSECMANRFFAFGENTTEVPAFVG